MNDEPTYCAVGTRIVATPVATSQERVHDRVPPQPQGQPAAGADSCRYANDNECDEPVLRPAGTDTSDCRNAGGNSQERVHDRVRRHSQGQPAGGADSCRYANDNECDEPTLRRGHRYIGLPQRRRSEWPAWRAQNRVRRHSLKVSPPLVPIVAVMLTTMSVTSHYSAPQAPIPRLVWRAASEAGRGQPPASSRRPSVVPIVAAMPTTRVR